MIRHKPPAAEVFHWNPRYSRLPGRLGRWSPYRPKVNNFGDLLGPLVVDGLLAERGLDADRPVADWQLMSVGSVLHFARDEAVVWGSGINGKIDESELSFSTLDVRAVRGPRTAERLRQRGIAVPDVFGDPGLLVSHLFPDLQTTTDDERQFGVAIVPNLNDKRLVQPPTGRDVLVNPRHRLLSVLRVLANSELVVGSSLHGIIVAEAFGVPARMVAAREESLFKYRDYYESTGRPDFTPARSVAEARELGGEAPLQWDPAPLLDAFPNELWEPVR